MRHALVGMLVFASVAACAAPGGQSAPGSAAAVTITGSFTFSPAQLEVLRVTSVTWTNRDSTEHTVTSGVPGNPSGTFNHVVEPGKSVSVTFGDAGSFTYFCSIHQTMRGTVTVK